MSGDLHTGLHSEPFAGGSHRNVEGISDSASVHESSALAETTGRTRHSGLFKPGQSGNPSGRPKGERALLQRMHGKDGRKVFKRLEALRNEPETPRRLKAQIDMFIIERMFGKAPQMVGVEGGPSLLMLLAEVAARTATAPQVEP